MTEVKKVFSHLALVVSDLEAMAAFYVEALGFQRGEVYSAAGRRVASLMGTEPDGFEGVFLGVGGFRLELLAYRTPTTAGERPRPASKPGYAHTSFVVDDFEATIEAIEQAGGKVLQRMNQRFAGRGDSAIAFCLDPEGNRVELIWHASRDEVAAHSQYLGMAQIGWPASDEVEIDGSGAVSRA